MFRFHDNNCAGISTGKSTVLSVINLSQLPNTNVSFAMGMSTSLFISIPRQACSLGLILENKFLVCIFKAFIHRNHLPAKSPALHFFR